VIALVTVTHLHKPDAKPEHEKCTLGKVDVLAPHAYEARIDWNAPEGGKNKVEVHINEWRKPGDGPKVHLHDKEIPEFKEGGPTTVVVPLYGLKAKLAYNKVMIDFVAEAWDPGTDDAAFFWAFNAAKDKLFPNEKDIERKAVQMIHIQHNAGGPRTDGTLAYPHFLGFSEPYFDRDANTGRSSVGAMGVQYRDTAVHQFKVDKDDDGFDDDVDPDDDGDGIPDVDDTDWDNDGIPNDVDRKDGKLDQFFFYVILFVLDDDNTRGYASPYVHDGTDMEFLVLDFRG